MAIEIINSYKKGDIDIQEVSSSLYNDIEYEYDFDGMYGMEHMSTLQYNSNGECLDPDAEFPRDIEVYLTILDVRGYTAAMSNPLIVEEDGFDSNFYEEILDTKIEELKNTISRESE